MVTASPPYALVAFPLAVEMEFTYAIPPSVKNRIFVGARVLARLRGKREVGFVTGFRDELDFDPKKLRELERPLDLEPIITPGQMEMARFVAEYYLCSMGEALRTAYPFPAEQSPRFERVLQLNASNGSAEAVLERLGKRAHASRKCVEFLLADPAPRTTGELMEAAGVSAGVISKLVKDNILLCTERQILRRPEHQAAFGSERTHELNHLQRKVLEQIGNKLNNQLSTTFLLHGVTGSGKTEVYLQAIARCLDLGRTALVLVPEIALTPQASARYRSRFGDEVAILHSGLGAGERFDEYHGVRTGQRRVVVGTRSAVFAPLANLGLVIVDEEHDGSYKQDTTPRYNGRDLAVWRARKEGAICVLGSATPSIESSYNAAQGKYGYLSLPKRAVPHGLPDVRLIDMRGRSGPEALVSRELDEALGNRLARKEQSILLLNRRGYASSVLCRQCGHILECPSCSISMVYHRDGETLICHQCEHREPVPKRCPACDEEFIRFKGIGTQQLAEQLTQSFPDARIERMDWDSTRRKGAHGDLQSRFWNREIDILVGTQMVAKGLDMPGVTLVGVLAADAALTIPDYRAAERTFALLTQVAGRAGRGENPGEVIVQSHCPQHYSVQAALLHDYKGFYSKEISYRKAVRFPPFSRMVNVEVSSEDANEAYQKAVQLAEVMRFMNHARQRQATRLIGPNEAPIFKVKNRFRWHVTVLAPTWRALRGILEHGEVREALRARVKDVRVAVDVDPWNLL